MVMHDDAMSLFIHRCGNESVLCASHHSSSHHIRGYMCGGCVVSHFLCVHWWLNDSNKNCGYYYSQVVPIINDSSKKKCG
eukprot:scaffold26976_cov181-Cylindrotheca_fusiformis.AAC.2